MSVIPIFNAPSENDNFSEPSLQMDGAPADRYNHRIGNEDYSQPGDLFRLMAKDSQERRMDQ